MLCPNFSLYVQEIVGLIFVGFFHSHEAKLQILLNDNYDLIHEKERLIPSAMVCLKTNS